MQGVLEIMGPKGDTKLIWDSENPDEVANAKKTFKELKEKGFVAYTVEKGGAKGEIIREFDPKAEKIILAPPMRGG